MYEVCPPNRVESRIRSFLLFGAALWLAILPAALQASEKEKEYDEINQIMGMQGEQMEGVLRFDLPRNDLTHQYVFGVHTLPNLVMDGYASYHLLTSETCQLVAEQVVKESEIDGVTAVLEKRFPLVKTTALHNHQFDESPDRLFYIHYDGIGDCEKLANVVQEVIAQTSMPRTNDDNQQDGDDDVKGIDTKKIEKIIVGGTGTGVDGIWEETVDRPHERLDGKPFLGPMDAEAELHFQPLDKDDSAVVAGEIPLSADELGPVSKYLRQNGFRLTAIHNHWADDSPRLIVLHVWKRSDAVSMARQLQNALSMTAYK